MKKILFLLFTIITIPTFSQNPGYWGTIKIKKVVVDTGCVASVLGYTGRNFITKKELMKAKKVELNKNCDYEIIESTIHFRTPEASVTYVGNGDTLDIGRMLKYHKEIPLIKIKILAKSKSSGKEIKLPPIIFDIVNEK